MELGGGRTAWGRWPPRKRTSGRFSIHSLFGLGFEVGLALVVIAESLDRLTEAAAERLRPPTVH